MNLKNGLIILVVIGVLCCKVAEPLSMDREDFTSDNLRIDGLYYNCDSGYCLIFYLFQNGVILIDGLDSTDFNSMIRGEELAWYTLNLQYLWGVFKIVDHTIKIERWLPGVGGPYPTQMYRGQILNDTTIAISGLMGRKFESEIDTFKFRYLEHKPDSTNAFIE